MFARRSIRDEALRQILGRLLEGDKHTGLVVSHGALEEKFHAEKRLARARAAHDERRTPLRQPATRDLIKARNIARSRGPLTA
jgi:hypothetical protein